MKFWGARGSIPTGYDQGEFRAALVEALAGAGPGDVGSAAAAEAYLDRADLPLRFGGDTTCVEFTNADGGRIVIDLGSGARKMGMAALQGETRPFTILMSHMHWDHVQGFPFFVPAFVPGNKLSIGGGHGRKALGEALFGQFAGPFFPVPADIIQAELNFFSMEPDKPVELEGFTVTPHKLRHGGDSYGYRLDFDGAAVVFASDAEHRLEDLGEDYPYVKWAKGADALIFDAQYSFADLVVHKEDWGHSSGLIGVDLAHMAEVDHILLTHHDPAGTDAAIHEMVSDTREYQQMLQDGGARALRVDAAHDGMVLEID